MSQIAEPETVSGRTPARIAGVPVEHRQAIVVGASSGMGAAIVRQLYGEGYVVAALARRGEELEKLAKACEEEHPGSPGRVIARAHDAAETGAVKELFEELARELGGLSLLVYAAGIMPKIEPREYDTEKDLQILTINFAGCAAWCNAAATYFQTQRRGTILGISSIAGDRGRKGNPMYGSSKAAMDHYLEALRNRLSEYDVHVCTIKPGYVATPMTEGLEGLFWVISADKAAKTMLSAARNRVNTRYVPMRWWAVGTIIKMIPSFVFRHLNF